MPVNKILLLPGMDGTGKLLVDFSRALPKQIQTSVPVYLTDRFLSYNDLAKLVRSLCEDSDPFVLTAESFSTPLAIRIAAENPVNLKALILCAGFAASPLRGLARWLTWLLAPVLLRTPPSDAVIQRWLTGADTPQPLLTAVREAISEVRPGVLAARLRALLACDVRSDLRRVTVPMLYLRAQQDRLIGLRCLAEIQRIRPDIQSVTVDGPHLLLQREPLKTAEIAAEFLHSLP